MSRAPFIEGENFPHRPIGILSDPIPKPANAPTRRSLLLAAGIGIVAPSVARADLYDDYINSVSKQPFVAFLARQSPGAITKPGHSYVGIGVELDNGLTVYERLLGYFPKDESTFGQIKAVFSKVSGSLAAQMPDLVWTVEYRVKVNAIQRIAAIAVTEQWLSNDPKYNMFAQGGKNCSSFAAEVAASVGLKVPSGPGGKFPVTFMQELKQMNTN